jgi:hypothetical protein
VLGLMPAALWAQDGRLVVVLDGSNSMWGRIDGVEKIVVARDVLSEVLADLPPDMQVGLIAYGHRQEQACDDIEVLLPTGIHSRETLEAAIRGVQPRGMTPITAALRLVADGLVDADGPTQMLLVSDGMETCDGDPCALVRTLRARGIDVRVHVVGFDVTGEEGEQLQCIAAAGGGMYADAGTADELAAALGDIRETVVAEVSEPGPPPIPAGDTTFWQLEAGEESYEGKISYAQRVDTKLVIQLVNRDAVNLGIRLARDGAMHLPEHVFFAAGRGHPCLLVASDPPFQVTLEPGDGAWLNGTFSGTLACPDYSALSLNGSFHIPAPGDRP